MTKSKMLSMMATISIVLTAQNVFALMPTGDATLDSLVMIQAAQDEIDYSNSSGNTDTACSTYLIKVLKRATFNIPHFVSNTMHESMQKALPNWRVAQFTINETQNDVQLLREFLNSLPDQTALLAQWSRVGQSGHAAMVVKVATNQFMIYQAQGGLALPHSKPTKVEGLLYATSSYGGRANLRLFYE